MLSGAYPIPANNGAKRRILATAQHLSRNNHLCLISFAEPGADPLEKQEPDSAAQWENHLVEMPCVPRWRTALKACLSNDSYGMTKYKDRNFALAVTRQLQEQQFDAIWLHTFNMVPYLEQCIRFYRGKKNRALYVLDQHNVDELYFGSFVKCKNPIISTFAFFEVRKNRILQKRWFPRFDAIYSVAAEDQQMTNRYVDEDVKVWLAPNGVDIDYFKPVEVRSDTRPMPIIVFGASLDVTMNQDAALWFATSIWPIVREKIGNAQFWIVGRNPPAFIQSMNGKEGITVTGTVPDIREYYRHADVFVVPVRYGGGTKLKTLEGMAMGLPVVSSSVGVQGLEIENGKHILVCDNPAGFAADIIDLLADRTKALQMGIEARRLVENHYSWESIVGKMDLQLRDLCSRKKVLNVKSIQVERPRQPEY